MNCRELYDVCLSLTCTKEACGLFLAWTKCRFSRGSSVAQSAVKQLMCICGLTYCLCWKLNGHLDNKLVSILETFHICLVRGILHRYYIFFKFEAVLALSMVSNILPSIQFY